MACEASVLLTIRFEDHDHGRFNCIGRCSGERQFMALVTGAYPSDPTSGRQRFPGPSNGITQARDQRYYGVVHLFDREGNHLETRARNGGTGRRRGAGERAFELANEELATLGELRFGDIRVRPFRVTVDDRVFGLVHEAEDGRETITLWPDDVVFYPPWTGDYDT